MQRWVVPSRVPEDGDLPLSIPMGCWQCRGLNAMLQVIDAGCLGRMEKVFRKGCLPLALHGQSLSRRHD